MRIVFTAAAAVLALTACQSTGSSTARAPEFYVLLTKPACDARASNEPIQLHRDRPSMADVEGPSRILALPTTQDRYDAIVADPSQDAVFLTQNEFIIDLNCNALKRGGV